jgi:hypothetical protein
VELGGVLLSGLLGFWDVRRSEEDGERHCQKSLLTLQSVDGRSSSSSSGSSSG